MNKFGNKKTEVDGITFDSRLEARFYVFAKELKAEGKIKDFELQKRFEVFPAYTFNDKKVRKIEYIADFVIHHHDGTEEIIDTKGVETDVFKLKKKMFEHKYQQELKAIQYSKIDGGWITLEELKKARKQRKNSK